ncbi:hypothetical protein ACH6CV_15070 [Bacillota bacterium Meth-B3]
MPVLEIQGVREKHRFGERGIGLGGDQVKALDAIHPGDADPRVDPHPRAVRPGEHLADLAPILGQHIGEGRPLRARQALDSLFGRRHPARYAVTRLAVEGLNSRAGTLPIKSLYQ